MLEIDGSLGEGGGQVLRTSLALSLATGTPVRVERIRAGRPKPGLRPQHLAGVRAAAAVGAAELEGAAKGSTALTFWPRAIRPGEHHVDVGTAGSATLVLQTVLPPLLTASAPSVLVVDGGTHNPFAPPYEFLDRVYFPTIERLGPRFRRKLVRPGFAPAGGGRIRVEVEPASRLAPLDLPERGAIRRRQALALVSRLPLHVAKRELAVVAKRLGWPPAELHAHEIRNARGPGNALLLEIESEHSTEVLFAPGERGVRAETVAVRAVMEAFEYLDADVPVGAHLADQLLLPLALGAGGRFRTLPLTSHARTQVEVLARFLPTAIEVTPSRPKSVEVTVRPGAAAA